MTIIRVGDIIFVQAPLCLVMTLLLAVVAVVFRTHVPVLQVHIVHIVFKIADLKPHTVLLIQEWVTSFTCSRRVSQQ